MLPGWFVFQPTKFESFSFLDQTIIGRDRGEINTGCYF
jgi:hypothetical protein